MQSEMVKRSSKSSDEGYNSDLSEWELSRDHLKVINREAKEFKEKYFIQELINNSANGVIYKGIAETIYENAEEVFFL